MDSLYLIIAYDMEGQPFERMLSQMSDELAQATCRYVLHSTRSCSRVTATQINPNTPPGTETEDDYQATLPWL